MKHKKVSRIFKALLVSLLMGSVVFTPAKANSGKGKPEQVFEVKAGKTIMKISSLGGRIVSFKQEGLEFLTQSAEHENFGSTLWTAPQSDWGWPPYEVLDNQEYEVERSNGLLKMTSKPDPKSGLQMEKSWQSMENQCIQIKYQLLNVSGREKAVGPWEVTRVPCGGLAFFPDGGAGNVPGSNLKADLQKEGINWISIDKNPIPDHRKLFSTASEGWLAYALDGVLFVKQFPDTKPEDYSPKQGEVEIYINKEKSYTELENQGAYQVLKPGESFRYEVNWYLISIPGKGKGKPGDQELAELVRLQIKNIKNKK